MMTENYQKWLTQFRKGYLELCVLRAIDQQSQAYGLEILKILQDAGLDVNEGTLYPLLNRMQKNGWLGSSWDTDTDSGHPRRFYDLSEPGRVLLPQMLTAFDQYSVALDKLGQPLDPTANTPSGDQP